MDSYFEIRALASDDEDTKPSETLAAVWGKLHLVIKDAGDGHIGVSFPEYGQTLGAVIRVHGTQEYLEQLGTVSWLRQLMSYVQISRIKPVPEIHQYRVFSRKLMQGQTARRRRAMKRHNFTEKEALERYPDIRLGDNLPHAYVKSLSTKQTMPIFVQATEPTEHRSEGTFGSYGLSNGAMASVPWF